MFYIPPLLPSNNNAVEFHHFSMTSHVRKLDDEVFKISEVTAQ